MTPSTSPPNHPDVSTRLKAIDETSHGEDPGLVLCSGLGRRSGLFRRHVDTPTRRHVDRELRSVAGLGDMLALGLATATKRSPAAKRKGRTVNSSDLARHPEPTSFVGRATEEEAIAQSFRSGSRLVTLLGPGGVGKPRLARRYLARADNRFSACFFGDLTAASSLESILGAVASALGLTLGEAESTGAALARIVDALRARGRTLVVQDNADGREQAVRSALDVWLDDTDVAAFLVTSRVRLGRTNERCIEIGPLPIGNAARLFEERARRAAPEFVADDVTRELVRRLDMNPLAIVLSRGGAPDATRGSADRGIALASAARRPDIEAHARLVRTIMKPS